MRSIDVMLHTATIIDDHEMMKAQFRCCLIIGYLRWDILNISTAYISPEPLAAQLHVDFMVSAYGICSNVLLGCKFHEGMIFALARVFLTQEHVRNTG